MFFVHGLGANGKSVFMITIADVMGDYHRNAPIETFTASSVDRHPAELAGLRGARLVTAVGQRKDAAGRRPRSRRSPVATRSRPASAFRQFRQPMSRNEQGLSRHPPVRYRPGGSAEQAIELWAHLVLRPLADGVARLAFLEHLSTCVGIGCEDSWNT
jgi:putative DNA primase/helicase